MALLALGINHKTAPVEIREKVVFAPNRLRGALGEMAALPEISEAAILSTCNRTEVYCSVEAEDANPVLQWLGQYHHLTADDLKTYVYTHPEQDAVRHILRVASGLDSMILGEPQILGQIKEAYHAAADAGTIGTLLSRLFQHTFLVAKQVRTDTAIGASPVSVAFAAVSLARQIFGELAEETALLIGAGETIELAARHLHDNHVGRMIVANRTVERAHTLAAEFDGYAIALDDIPVHLEEADIVVSSTASPEPLLTRTMVKQALKKRKHRPMFMVDVAVPRDIAPEVGELDDIYLYTVDDLHDVIEENLQSRQEAAQQAEEIIDIQVAHFMGWIKSLDAVHTIRAVRSRADRIRGEVLARAQHMLEVGKPADEVVQYLAHTLTNKLLHSPSANLKMAGYQGRRELIKAARELFEIKPDE
ncbi:MAG: glutamyl-tRNA reductase [Gammaproteobacteria bacterium]